MGMSSYESDKFKEVEAKVDVMWSYLSEKISKEQEKK